MELSYVWVKSFRNIKETGFCFSKEWDIDVINNELIIKPKSSSSPFDNSNVDFRILSGKNGCGKSNLLDLIGISFNIFINSQKNLGKNEELPDNSDEYVLLYINEIKTQDEHSCDGILTCPRKGGQ